MELFGCARSALALGSKIGVERRALAQLERVEAVSVTGVAGQERHRGELGFGHRPG